ncbi:MULTISPECIES: hypothetical protein [unclassified Microbacterium]|uniref:hypothetical protein n=1 Tax=unclassified Microbacterium TaxID=2609290 RepID=UPI0030196F46
MTSRQLRLVRAAAVSAVATLIAAVSHTIGGGAAPHPLLILAVATLLTPLSALLVGARQSRGRVAFAVLGSQALFHLLFQVLGSPTGAASNVGHAHHLDLAALDPVAPVASPGAIMLFAHVVAALLTTLLVWHGESLVRLVARWVETLLRRSVPVAPVEHRRPSPPRATALASLDAAVTAALSRRGPPLLVRD